MCIGPAVFRRTVCPWKPHPLWLFMLFLSLLLLGFLIPEGRNLTGTFHLELSVPVFAPYIILAVGLCICSHQQQGETALIMAVQDIDLLI